MASIQTIQPSDLITDSRADINSNFANLNSDKIETSVIDTDTTLAANSDTKIPSQKAVKAYIDAGGATAFPSAFVTTSAGAADADKGVKLNSSGVLDSTLLGTLDQSIQAYYFVEMNNTSTTVAASLTETTAYTKSLSAGFFKANSGFKIRIIGLWDSASTAGDSKTIKVKLAGTTIATFTNSVIDTCPIVVWAFDVYVINNASLSSQKYSSHFHGTSAVEGTSPFIYVGTSSGTSSIDTSGTVSLTVTIQNGDNDAGDSITVDSVLLEKIG